MTSRKQAQPSPPKRQTRSSDEKNSSSARPRIATVATRSVVASARRSESESEKMHDANRVDQIRPLIAIETAAPSGTGTTTTIVMVESEAGVRSDAATSERTAKRRRVGASRKSRLQSRERRLRASPSRESQPRASQWRRRPRSASWLCSRSRFERSSNSSRRTSANCK